MATYRVLVSDYVFESFDAERTVLEEVDAALELHQCKAAGDLLPHLPGAHALLNTYMPGIGREVFEAAPELRVVVRYGIGVDTIDIAEATRRGIMVANVPDYCVDEVADHAVAHFLCLARKLTLSDRKVKGGDWSLSYVKPLKAVYTMQAGIIGFGRIGRAIAARLAAFGVSVVFHDPFADADRDGCRRVDLDELYASSDVVFVQCPANDETHHLIDRAAFERMQKRPILVNCARGAIVDTDAVVWALQTGRLAAAGLDLLEDEQAVVDGNHPLKTMDNVLLTPHSAWFSATAIQNLQRKAAEEVARVLRGETPKSLVNPDVLERGRP